MKTLYGKVAVVTGGTFGVGHGIARALADSGARMFVTGRSVRDGEAIDEDVEDVSSASPAFAATTGSIQSDDRVRAHRSSVAR